MCIFHCLLYQALLRNAVKSATNSLPEAVAAGAPNVDDLENKLDALHTD